MAPTIGMLAMDGFTEEPTITGMTKAFSWHTGQMVLTADPFYLNLHAGGRAHTHRILTSTVTGRQQTLNVCIVDIPYGINRKLSIFYRNCMHGFRTS